MTVKAALAPGYGLGGVDLDPPGGQRLILQKGHAMGLIVPPAPFSQATPQDMAAWLKKQSEDTLLFIEGDSCFANKVAWVAAEVYPRKIAGLYSIQASIYCNTGCPHIGPNVERALIIYSDFIHTGGLGTYIPIPEIMPDHPMPELYKPADSGWHLANKGKTLYRRIYVPAHHPDDEDVERVQNPIFADIRAVLAAHQPKVA
jgi:hypothetical protein